ncbi:MAG TPA: hypothetical protein VJS66_02540 [Burkholderiales bacterium]|nr:hypothetical protein [Burkholderiales bacterium]
MNHADILRASGFNTPNSLYALISAWRSLFGLLRPDRVVCEYAPMAGLAADTLDLPVVCVDNGFSMPPLADPLPALNDTEAVETSTLQGLEQQTLSVINDVLRRLRRSPLSRFADIFDRQTWYRNWVEFSHFGTHSLEKHVGQVFREETLGAPPRWPAGEGRRIFAHLAPGYMHSIKVLEEAATLGYRIFAYVPGFPDDVLGMLRMNKQMVISDAPVYLADLDDDVEIGICHEPTEAAVRCWGKGVRMLFLPMTIEQHWACRAVKRCGLPLHIATNNDNWSKMFDAVQASPRLRVEKIFEPADVPLLAQRLAVE